MHADRILERVMSDSTPSPRQHPEPLRDKRSIGQWLAPPRFLLFFGCAIAATLVAVRLVDVHHALLAGFDVGAAIFLISLWPLLRVRDAGKMREQVAANDANRPFLLLLAAVIMLAVLGALAVELAAKGNPPPPAIALIIMTLVCSWLFTNSIFALHYAHIFYSADRDGKDCDGIEFPGDAEPLLWDFIYFAFCLGMTFQTSDTNITSSHIRKVATFHSMMAFVFSIGVIAFTINVLGGAGATTVAAQR